MARNKIIKDRATEILSTSSFIRRIIYFWKRKQLFIFIGKSLYVYMNVPETVYYELKDCDITGESIGSYFGSKIKDKYNFELYGEVLKNKNNEKKQDFKLSNNEFYCNNHLFIN